MALLLYILAIQAGLSKLNEATALVDELKQKAAEQSILLAQKQAEADEALKEITVSMQVRDAMYYMLLYTFSNIPLWSLWCVLCTYIGAAPAAFN